MTLSLTLHPLSVYSGGVGGGIFNTSNGVSGPGPMMGVGNNPGGQPGHDGRPPPPPHASLLHMAGEERRLWRSVNN